ncbi:MAG: hypothetical protein VX017_10500, partial [Pseudomonadota bacterium]|nr:hypothetical protein [Pseudomonadota bacterium]
PALAEVRKEVHAPLAPAFACRSAGGLAGSALGGWLLARPAWPGALGILAAGAAMGSAALLVLVFAPPSVPAVGAALLLLAASAHWWPFVFFLVPAISLSAAAGAAAVESGAGEALAPAAARFHGQLRPHQAEAVAAVRARHGDAVHGPGCVCAECHDQPFSRVGAAAAPAGPGRRRPTAGAP